MRRNRARGLTVAVVAVVISVTAVAAAFGSSAASGTVAVRSTSDYTNFDFQANTPGLMHYISGGYDRLLMLADGKVVPYLATKWTVTRKSVTLSLRKDAKCANGNQITPNVVARSFQRLFTVPKTGVNLAGFFGPGPWSMTADEKNWTVTFKTLTPFRGLTYGLASDQAAVVCPAGLANPDLLKTNWLGSGPYGLVSAAHGDQIVLKLRKDWKWGPVINGKQMTAKDLPDTQVWKVVTNDTTAANLLLTSGLDIARVSGPDIDRLANNSSFTKRAVKVTFPTPVNFNLTPGHPTADKALRKALSTAINNKDMNQAMTGGLGTPVTSFIQPGYECYDPKTKALYPATGSIDKAKQILTQAGYKGVGSSGGLTSPDGKPVKIKIAVIHSLVGNSGEYLLNQWKQLGANIDLNDGESGTISLMVFRGDFDVAMAVDTATVPDPSATAIQYFYGKTVAQGGLNLFGPSVQADPKWNQLIRGGMQNVGSLGCKYWIQAQERALTENILLPIASNNFFIFHRAGWTSFNGYRLNDPLLIRAK